jgi:tRNA(fMet)-specific endonuclease VapC
MIILDTDAVTFLEHRDSAVSGQLRNRLTVLSSEHDVVATIVTFEEQTRGWLSVFAQARDPASLVAAYNRLLLHLNTFKEIDVIPFTLTAEAKFRELRAHKIRIGTRDLRIAAIALSLDATLLTRNLRDFGQIPGLRVEDWTKP